MAGGSGRESASDDSPETAGHLVNGFPFGIPDWAQDGLEKARCAQFEWGKSG